MTMKILYLSPGAELGGAEQSLLGLLSCVDRERFHPVVVLPRPGPLAEDLHRVGADVRIISFPKAVLTYGRSSGMLWSLVGFSPAVVGVLPVLFRLARLIHTERIGLVHSNGIKAHLIGCLLHWMIQVPLVWHMRDILPPGPLQSLFRFLARRTPSAIIANSRAVADCISDGSVGSPRLRVIPNGIDVGRYAPTPGFAPLKQEYGLDPRQPTVGIVGVLAPWKGFEVFLEAAAVLRDIRRDMMFFVVGDEIYDTRGHSGYRRRLEDKACALGLEGRVIFAGFRRDIPAVMNSLDVVVHASVRPEPFGRVIMEAMACGRPVIAMDAGGVREVLGTDRSSGVLIPHTEVTAMSQAILELIRDPVRRDRMGQAGRDRAVSCFSIADHARAVEKVYTTILGTI